MSKRKPTAHCAVCKEEAHACNSLKVIIHEQYRDLVTDRRHADTKIYHLEQELAGQKDRNHNQYEMIQELQQRCRKLLKTIDINRHNAKVECNKKTNYLFSALTKTKRYNRALKNILASQRARKACKTRRG